MLLNLPKMASQNVHFGARIAPKSRKIHAEAQVGNDTPKISKMSCFSRTIYDHFGLKFDEKRPPKIIKKQYWKNVERLCQKASKCNQKASKNHQKSIKKHAGNRGLKCIEKYLKIHGFPRVLNTIWLYTPCLLCIFGGFEKIQKMYQKTP